MYHPPCYVLAFQQNALSTSSACVLCEGNGLYVVHNACMTVLIKWAVIIHVP